MMMRPLATTITMIVAFLVGEAHAASSTDQVRRAQQALADAGFYNGSVNGVPDAATARAWTTFMLDQKQGAETAISDETIARVKKYAAEHKSAAPATEPTPIPSGPLGASDYALMTKDQCTKLWLKAENAGIFFGEGMKRGVVVVVVADDSWARANFDTKQNMVALLECAVLGPRGGHFPNLEFRSHMTNKVLGTWECGAFHGCDLSVE